jgi:uncharacterized membrane protein YqgA involved in biofilm formation
MMAIALCTFVIGVQSAIQTGNILIVMICLVLGTVIGVWLKLDDRMNGASDRIKERLKGTKLGSGPFAEAFMTTTMLFCVGTMTVIGSIEAGLNHNYDILIAKSIMDYALSLDQEKASDDMTVVVMGITEGSPNEPKIEQLEVTYPY